VTANIFNEKVTYTIVMSDLTKLNNEKNKAKGFEEEMLVSRFELENKTEMLEALLVKNKIELPGIDQEYSIVDYSQNKIGLNIIDSQVKKWIEHINKFYSDFKRKATPKVILQSFDELIDYTGYHFGFEDKYLKDFNYTKYDEIKQNHDQFTNTLQKHRADFAEGENIAIIKAITFIKSWMSNYKSTIDAEFISLFKSHGLA
jgi:hemerythrin-like metal-binding protein